MCHLIIIRITELEHKDVCPKLKNLFLALIWAGYFWSSEEILVLHDVWYFVEKRFTASDDITVM